MDSSTLVVIILGAVGVLVAASALAIWCYLFAREKKHGGPLEVRTTVVRSGRRRSIVLSITTLEPDRVQELPPGHTGSEVASVASVASVATVNSDQSSEFSYDTE